MTNIRAYMKGALMAVALIGAVTIAVVGPAGVQGDPPILNTGGEGESGAGGADPPGGITDDSPEASNTDGSWTVNVDGTEFAGLTEADSGTVLWRGASVNSDTTEVGDSSLSREICEPFPDFEL